MNYLEELEFIKGQMIIAFEKFGNIELHTAQKTAFDLVTDIDINIEKQLTEVILKKYPADLIHGEEFSAMAHIDRRTWTIDPIDGTCNMASGSKLFGMQCSLIDNGEIVLGVVYLPHFNEMIYATKGFGSYCNGKKIKVNNRIETNNAIVSFGDYPHTKGSNIAEIQHSVIRKLYPQLAKIRMFGAACMDFSFVAQGRTHGTVVITKNIWDIAPGIIICKEAGAVVTNLKGKTFKIGDDGVIASANTTLSTLISGSFAQNYNVEINGHIHNFSACIFDFDGVIADTEKFHYLAWAKAFKSIGVNLTPDEYNPLKSTGRANILEFIEKKIGLKLTDKQKSEINRIKDETFSDLIEQINENDMIAGACKFLQCLKSNFVKSGVASSSKTTKSIIEKLRLNGLFDVVIDGQANLPKKPAPDIFLAVMNNLGVAPQNCVVFEDSISGIEAALKTGAAVIAVGELRDARALLCIDDLTIFND